MTEQIFKPYTPKQGSLLPSNLEEMNPIGALTRGVDEMIERLTIEPLKRQ